MTRPARGSIVGALRWWFVRRSLLLLVALFVLPAPAAAAPAPAALLVAGEAAPGTLKYTTGGAIEDLTPAQVAERVRLDPAADHLVWRYGLYAWVPAAKMPEVAAALAKLPKATVTRPAPPAAPPPAPTAAIAPPPPAALPAPVVAAVPAPPPRPATRSVPAVPDALLDAATLTPSADVPGEGAIYLAEPPPLPGELTEIEVEIIPPDKVEELLRAEAAGH